MKRIGLLLFALLNAALPAQATQRFERHPTYPAQFWWLTGGQSNWIILHDFRVEFEITEPSILRWYGSINMKHRGVGTAGPVGWGVKASLLYAETCAELPAVPSSGVDLAYWQAAQPYILYGSKRAGNIASLAQHYDTADLNGRAILEDEGCYRQDWFGAAHSDGVPYGTNGLIEINMNGNSSDTTDPYSVLFVDVEPLN